MYPLGHYGLALVFAAPIAWLLGRKAGTVFTMFTLLAAILPDIDTYVPYVQHHGLTHTFVFGVGAGLLTGAVAAVGIAVIWGHTGPDRYRLLTPRHAFIWGATGVFIGVSAHIVGDVFTVLAVTQPITPFWPIDTQLIQIDVWRYGVVRRNLLLFALGVGVHGLIYWRADKPGVALALAPLAVILGTSLSAYTLWSMVISPSTGPLSGRLLPLVVGVGGFVLGLGLLGRGLVRLDVLRAKRTGR